MNFGLVQTGMLAGLLALAVPYIIHLMFRQKPREFKMGSVRFLREIMEKHRNRKKILRWLLMALRMACIALIALMFARPFFNELSKTDGDERLVVILIDKSASMQLLDDGVSLTSEAVTQAKEIIRSAEDNTKFEIAFFDHQVHPLTGETDDSKGNASQPATTSQLLNELAVPEASYSATDYAAAFRWAHDICASSKSDLRQLHVFTDLQQSGLAWSNVEPMPDSVKVNVHDLGRDLPNNIAITRSTPSRLVVRPGDSTTVEVALLNSGPFALDEVPVKLDIKNDTRTVHKHEKVKLEPGSVERIEFELPKLEIGLWEGSVTVETIDDLSFDNLRHVAILAKPQYRVLVVDDDDEEGFLSETHHLQTALRLAPAGKSYEESPYAVVADSIGRSFEDFDVIVLANVQSVAIQDATRLKKFVNAGGGLVVFGGEKVTAAGYEALQDNGMIPGKLLDVEEAIDLPWRIATWNKDNSIFAPFNDPQHGDLRQLAFRGLIKMQPSTDANVVARFRDEIPFVITQSIGEQGGGVVWVTTSCGSRWSNWTQSGMYLPIVHQMLGHLTGLNTGGPLQEALLDTNSEQLESRVPGVFRSGKATQVVNVSPRESETERCSVEDFASRFELNIGDQEIGVPAARLRRASFSSALDVRQNEIWHWILFALVTLGAVEFFLANRTVA
jgi:uncharacterized membrane protein